MRDDEKDLEWTPSERLKLNSLGRERLPSDMLRARTIAELRQRDLVRTSGGSTLGRVVRIGLAASLVFAAGGFVGYRIALTRVETRVRLATVASETPATDSLVTAGHIVWF